VGCRTLSRQHVVASELPSAFGLLRAAAAVQAIGPGASNRPWCEQGRRGMRRDTWGVQVVEAHVEGQVDVQVVEVHGDGDGHG